MKSISYGKEYTKQMVKSDMMFLGCIHCCIGNVAYVFINLWLHLPVYFYVLYVCIYVTCLFVYVQYKANKQVVLFEEKKIVIKVYPAWIYLSILRNKKPDTVMWEYEEIEYCKLSYKKARKRSTQAYDLLIDLKAHGLHKQLVVHTNAISDTKMNAILLLLSQGTRQFNDSDMLALCLMRNKQQFDTYIRRLEEAHVNS